MTDKEQIIINGVDVSKCKYLNTFSDCDGYHYYCDLADYVVNEYCEYYKDCYFKQLARKAQECEKLKSQVDEDYNYYTTELKTLRDIISNKEKRNAALFLTSGRYLKTLEPFEDEYFKGLDTKQIAELAKKSIRLTTENRKLENKLSDIAGICEQILDGEDYVRRIAKTILDIINKAKDGNNDR